MPSLRSNPEVADDPGLGTSINAKLSAISAGVLTELPNNEIDLLRSILVTQTALLLAVCSRLDSPQGEGAEVYLDLAADLLQSRS